MPWAGGMMSALPMVENASVAFAWFGKLPSAGDFISRRMAYALQGFWDGWLGSGMQALKARNDESGWRVWGATPHWAFILPEQPAIPFAQFGVLAPSCDRVGRNFPFVLTMPFNDAISDQVLARSGTVALAWSEVIEGAIRNRLAVELVDRALAERLESGLAADVSQEDGDTTLRHGDSPRQLPWPGLSESFETSGAESYWWSVPPARTGFRAVTHVGSLSSSFFLALCA